MSKNHRIVVLILISIILALFLRWPATAETGADASQRDVIYSSLFLLAFSVLLLEHFFTRPTDVLASAVSILLLMLPGRVLFAEWGSWYWVFFYFEVALAIIAVTSLMLLASNKPSTSIQNRIAEVCKSVSVGLGSSKKQYGLLLLLSTLFFTTPQSPGYFALLLFAGAIFLIDPQRAIGAIPTALRAKASEVGELLGYDGDHSFSFRVSGWVPAGRVLPGSIVEIRSPNGVEPVSRCGVVVACQTLGNQQRARVLLQPAFAEIINGSSGLSRRLAANIVYLRTDIAKTSRFERLVGVVHDRSETELLRFERIGTALIEEGDLIATTVERGEVVYQVTNARVETKSLAAHDEADTEVGEAVQLGRWNADLARFVRHGWVPPGGTPVLHLGPMEPPVHTEGDFEIGVLPGTSMPVRLNKELLVSHHTAILGVTGVGKSVFARNLVRTLQSDDVRIVVVDFTREWAPRMQSLGGKPIFSPEAEKPLYAALRTIDREMLKYPDKRDETVVGAQKHILHTSFKAAIEGMLDGPAALRVLELPDVANTESALQFTQWFFRSLFSVAKDQGLRGKRVCVVLEEAHTVVPEWNFLGVSDKASAALVNSIGQIALQGRKYGVGFIVLAQRTASVSKTVLTQCNTLIAFQCFDATSLEFLAHYMPASLVRLLPGLKPRRAVIVGKALIGGVPLIVQIPEIDESAARATPPLPAVPTI